MSEPQKKGKNLEDEIKKLQAQLESLQNLAKNAKGKEDEKADESSLLGRKKKQQTSSDDGDDEDDDEDSEILIVVANRLPVSIQYVDNKWRFKPSAGGLVTALKQLGNLRMEWVGCPGYIEPMHRQHIEGKLNEYNVHPVFVEKRDYENYYNGFCNGIVWPLFHYIELNDEIVVPYFNKFYTSYSRINLLFAKAIDALIGRIEAAKGKKITPLVWIHDYHLMLCPNYVRRLRRDAQIGFFLHIPFPTWEQFRILPKSDNLLQGLLACNLIGFHIHDYAQHFRGACAHILQCELAPDAIIYHGRMTIISTHPIGTDINKWRQGLQTREIQDLIVKYKAVHRDKQIILGVDRLDFIKGIPHKLYAFSKFLEDNPSLREKVVFIQIAVPSRQTAPEYIKLTKKCNELVGKINSKYSSFSSVPIHFLYQSFGFNDLVALYNISCVCYVTSLRDGMNLVSYEYISCQSDNDPGVLIVSEFAGSAQSLGCGSIVINPWNIDDVASALHTALTMDLKQRQTHQKILNNIITKNTVQYWANSFLQTLQISYSKCPQNAPIVPSPCNLLNIQRVFKTNSANRVIILGLGGTIFPSISKYSTLNLGEYTSMKRISSKMRESINKLSRNENITVAILSSLPRRSIEMLLRDTYCIQYAENGYFMRDCRINSKQRHWRITTNYTDNSWKEEVLKIMRYFKERTPNTTLDDLTSFVTFRYNVIGNLMQQQQQQQSSLSATTRNNISQCVTSLQTGPLQSSYARLVHDTSMGHIQVRQPGVSKLSSITRLIQKLSSEKPIDYILCIANFLSFDEEVFVYLNGLQEEYNAVDSDGGNDSAETHGSEAIRSTGSDSADGAVSSPNEEWESSLALRRGGSSSSLAKMYPNTDTDQVKFTKQDHTENELSKTHELSSNAIVHTIKVGRYATRANHYVADHRKVEDILFRLSQIVINSNEATPMTGSPKEATGSLAAMRNWSVGSDLARLSVDLPVNTDEIALHRTNMGGLVAASPDLADIGLGGDKLFNPMHDENRNDDNMKRKGNISAPPTLIPPTAEHDSDRDYGSYEDELEPNPMRRVAANKMSKSLEHTQADDSKGNIKDLKKERADINNTTDSVVDID